MAAKAEQKHNTPKELKLTSLKGITRGDVPRAIKGGVINSLSQLKDIELIAQHVKAEGVMPYEAFDVLDMKQLAKEKPEIAKIKTFLSSFLMASRRILKEYQVDKKLQMQQRADRVFLVSLE